MSPPVEALDRLNRKEQFWLLSDAVGRDTLRAGFIEKLQNELRKSSPNLTIPNDAWWAFDYHLDWLFAVLDFAPQYKLDFTPRPDPGNEYIKGTDEDCDLIIAFGSTIILVEAKVAGAWSNRQLTSKMRRLKLLKSPQSPKIYFVLASPASQRKIEFDEWPDWVFNNIEGREPYSIALELPDSAKIWVKVMRCDKEGTSKDKAEFWRLCKAGK